jgi:hypothetical protein
MGLMMGISIDMVAEHLLALYILTRAPRYTYTPAMPEKLEGGYDHHMLWDYTRPGRKQVEKILSEDAFRSGSVGWRETYPNGNCDWRHNLSRHHVPDAIPTECFGATDIRRVEEKILAVAQADTAAGSPLTRNRRHL